MPIAPTYCRCGHLVRSLSECPCAQRDAADRKARAEANRPSARQRGYDSKWDLARAEFLSANQRCSWPGCDQPATVVDHKVPHRGNSKLMWSRSNWQALCSHHHSSAKQRQERKGSVAEHH